MSHTYRNNKNSNDNTAPAKVIRSPDGTEIQITAGRKLQVIRSFASDPEITDAQFRTLVCIVDRLNEGKRTRTKAFGVARIRSLRRWRRTLRRTSARQSVSSKNWKPASVKPAPMA